VNYAYASDAAGAGLDRTLEGFVEIIEMATVEGATRAAVTHANGVPSCNLPGDAGIQADTRSATGGLMGSLEIVNVLEGTSYITAPTALSEFSTLPIWTAPGTINPTLASVQPKVATIVDRSSIVTMGFSPSTFNPFPNPADPVSAVLMREAALNEYSSDPALSRNTATSMVVTFPTKRHYVDSGSGGGLFQSNFGAGGSCDDISVTAYDREERTFSPSVAPVSPATRVDALCWSTNVLTINGANLFGSAATADIGLASTGGWLEMRIVDPDGGPHNLRSGSASLFGLPFIGFAASKTLGGVQPRNDGNVQTNFGGVLNQAYRIQLDTFESFTAR
jgi:hypothetical protein